MPMSQSEPMTMLRCSSRIVEGVYASRQIPTADGGASMDVYIPREEGTSVHFGPNIAAESDCEIGLANGLSSFSSPRLRDNGKGRYIAIDPFQSTDCARGMALAASAGLSDLIDLIELPSSRFPTWGAGTRVEFAFVDGSHLYDYVLTDFLCADRLLSKGGLIAFDDSDWPAVTQAIRFVLANRHYEVAFPDVVIESAKYTPGFASRFFRSIARKVPKFRAKLRDDFVAPSFELGIRGRCVVLRKLKDDDRDSQSRFHNPF